MTRRSGAAEGFVPAVSYSITVRAQYRNRPGMLGLIASAIGDVGGDIGAVDLVRTNPTTIVRDVTIGARDSDHGRCIVDEVRKLKGVTVRSVSDPTFMLHAGGKIEIHNKVAVTNRGDLSRVYTPGVARVSKAIYDDPEVAWTLTTKRNTVAIVTDGSAVLGLGDICPAAARLRRVPVLRHARGRRRADGAAAQAHEREARATGEDRETGGGGARGRG